LLALLCGGLGPGLLAGVLSGVVVDYLLLPPYYTLTYNRSDFLRVLVFVGTEAALCVLLDSSTKKLRHSEEEVRRMNSDLEQRVAERSAQLQTANAYNRSLLEASLDPLVTIGVDGKITDVNAATEAVTGCARAMLIATDFSDYFTDPEKARAGYQQVFREGWVRDYPLEVRRRDGHITSVLYNASLYRDEGGKVIGVFAAARDVTERKRAEEKILRYAEDLKRSNQELEHFAYVASHDLQEPLRTVSSFSQLLARRYQGRLDDDAHDFIDFIVDGASRMQTLINDLLAFSRIGTRGNPFEQVACEKILKHATENLDAAIAESGAAITHDPLPTVKADRTQLTQLFQNLFGNAIKFRREGEAPRIHVSAAPQDGTWHFSVRDNGIGIAPEYFDRIFVLFQRLHGRQEYPGTGMGLAICKKIVERHRGRMWVESEPGTGSIFHFTIPNERTSL
jgi:PAS domain S-box-containing protein